MSKKKIISGNPQKLPEMQTIKILVVKATEENSKNVLTGMSVSSANIHAIGAKSDIEYLSRRANFLFDLLPASIQNINAIDHFPINWMKLSFFITVIFGLVSNYLGPVKLIHVVYNPLTILLVWNILIYILLIVKSLFHIGSYSIDKPVQAIRDALPKKKEQPGEEDNTQKKKKTSSGNFILDRMIGGLFRLMLSYKSKVDDESAKVSQFSKIWLAFFRSYKVIAGEALLSRFFSVINTGAIGLVVGALAGVYFRGLFFNYNMIWASTFVSSPETIGIFLNVLLGPASLILDGHLIGTDTIHLLLGPEGTSAAPWIHKMALSAFLFVVIPRTFLAVFYARIAKRKIRAIELDDEYYSEILEKSREGILEVIRDGIREIITKKIKRISMTISDFVSNDYYAKIIEPILINFRAKGGKIKTLEKELLLSQEKFEPILLSYLKEIQEDFREGILTEINMFLGRKLDIDINTISSYSPQSDEIDQKISNKLAEEIGDTIGGTIVTTIALAAGGISGGIGKSLGIAIISGLLGVSGPIGLLIGGLITAVTLTGFYTLKRDQISGMIKEVPLPGFVIAMTLSDAKIEKGRKDTFEHTKKEIAKMLQPKINEVTEGILKDLTY